VVPQPDGKVLIGGRFATVNGATRDGIARLNPDGSTDYTFMNRLSGPNNWVRCVALQNDGKVLVAGWFTSVSGASRNGIARLNADGSLDSDFLNGLSGADSLVNSVVVQDDGKILIGGEFRTVNGVTHRGIARLNVDGSLDTQFQNALSPNSYVDSVAIQSDGKVLISGLMGGSFGVARLGSDGGLDTGFLQSGANGEVYTLALDHEGNIVAAGNFTLMNGVSRNGIARLSPNGSLDSSFQDGMPGAYTVGSLAIQDDGKIVIGGTFTMVNGIVRNRIARLNSDGSLDTNFQNSVSGADDTVRSVAIDGSGRVLLAGYFNRLDDATRTRVARLNADGTLDPAFAHDLVGTIDSVESIALQGDKKILIAGSFVAVNGVIRNHIARLNADGSPDIGFLNGLSGPDRVVYSVASQKDGKLLIGGDFFIVNGLVRPKLVRLNGDGSLDGGFSAGVSGTVNSIVVQGDGGVVFGGAFGGVNGVGRNRIARVRADGTLDATFQNDLSGANGTVRSVVLQSDGKLLIGGDFTAVNTAQRTRIARLNSDGSLDPTFQSGLSGADGPVLSIATQTDGKVLFGGNFHLVNGASRNFIARLNTDGSSDVSFQNGVSGPDGTVHSVIVQNDGRLLIAGEFGSVNGVSCDRIARLNSDGTVEPTLQTRFQKSLSGLAAAIVNTMAVQSDGQILIGGNFRGINGVPVAGVARLWGTDQPSSPYIENITRPGGDGVMVTVRLQIDTTNRLQYRTNWQDVWVDLPGDLSVNCPNCLTNKVDHVSDTDQTRFYRVRQVP